MGRKKKVDPPYWVTGQGCGKAASGQALPFVQIYADLMQAPAFYSLSAGARWCYLSMAIEAKGKRALSSRERLPSGTGLSTVPSSAMYRNCRMLAF